MDRRDENGEEAATSPRIASAEQVCARFERAWQAGEPPRIEDFLPAGAEAERAALLEDLIRVELSYRAAAGAPPRVDEYHARFPHEAARIAAAFGHLAAPRVEWSAGEASSRDGSLADTAPPSPAPTPPADDEPDAPPRIGRYKILRRLGRGGFATVWLADDEELRRQVAIKLPRRDRLTSDESVAEFLREARIAAALKHPAIVTIHDVGRLDDGRCFVVMEYIAGGSLADELAAARPDAERAARLIEEVAEAVHYAHKEGLVHRDLKPANILLDKARRPHVVDFGLAIHEEQQPRHRGERAGTPRYMAPEQVRGESHRLDGRADIWALGVTLYELLSGRRPFVGQDTLELFDEIQHREPRPPRQIDDALPAELERICLKCLGKRATDRYPTAADLAADLKYFRESQADRGEPMPRRGKTSDDRGKSDLVATPDHAARPRIVPKGLRSFDAHDADFFLQLLPGPTDREGLPESLRFWKTRIEETDADATFAVGLIYGPSGCGKSSLVKAGLLPRLDASVSPVYLEATADDTESRLLNGLKKAAAAGGRRRPDWPPQTTIADALFELRRGGLAPGQKLLIVLDQFEQWLHAHRDPEATELVLALRQCDGTHLQAIVMVRDDFWMAASRFMQALEIPLVERENSAAVDLFDPRHARRVLTLFGRAFDCLADESTRAHEPSPRLPESRQQARRVGIAHHELTVGNAHPTRPDTGFRLAAEFIDQAVAGLSEDGKVVSVRLALFAEMVKGKPWTPATLRAIGGISGVGATFLEETFSASTAPPRHRFHQQAARAVLKALLPEAGSEIKGHRRARDELLAASGYARRPADFAELMRILDAELRLVTPVDDDGRMAFPGRPEEGSGFSVQGSGEDAAQPPDAAAGKGEAAPLDGLGRPSSRPRSYQLTHDYLVPSLRDWLTRKQKETRRGRAELLLADRAAVWNARPESRQLPSLAQWFQVRSLTAKKNWTPPQRKMMRRAGRHHTLRAAAGALLLTVATITGLTVRDRAEERRKATHAAGLVHAVLNADTAQTPAIIAEMAGYRQWTDALLRKEGLSAQATVGRPARPSGAQDGSASRPTDGDASSRAKLHASLALLPVDAGQVDYLYARFLAAEPDEIAVLRDALTPQKAGLIDKLWAVVQSSKTGRQSERLRAAAALAKYDPDSEKWAASQGPVADDLVAVPALHLSLWIEALRPVRAKLLPRLSGIYADDNRQAVERSLATDILADYAAGDAKALVNLIENAQPEQFLKLFPLLEKHRDAAIGLLAAELERKAAPDWRDAPLNPSWGELPAETIAKVEAAEGLVAERFALVQTLPLADFEPLAADMARHGYRPIRLRPYSTAAGLLAAAVWRRDGIASRSAVGLAADEIMARDKALQAEGYVPVDVAGYPSPRSPAVFAALWVKDRAEPGTVLLQVDLADPNSPEMRRLVQDGFGAAALGQYRGTADAPRYAMVLRKSAANTWRWDHDQSTFQAEAATDNRQLDVSLCQGDSRRPDTAAQLAKAEQAAAEKPDDLKARAGRALARLSAGQDQAAIGDLTFVLEKLPQFAGGFQLRARAYLRLRELEKARADLEQFKTLGGQPSKVADLEMAIAIASDQNETGLNNLNAAVAGHWNDHGFLYDAARGCALAAGAVGDTQPEKRDAPRKRALELLAQAVALGYDDFAHLRDDDDFANVRELPEFQAIVARGHLERRYAVVFESSATMISTESHGLAPAAHLARCRELAAGGYRPAAISFAEFSAPRNPPAQDNGAPAALIAASVWHLPRVADADKERIASRQANAAAALARLGEVERVWPLLVHSPDPRLRSWLIHRLGPLGVAPKLLIDRLFGLRAAGTLRVPSAEPPTTAEPAPRPNESAIDRILFDHETSIRRALLLALGEFDEASLPPSERARLLPRLVELYRADPDAGVHAAAAWLARQWGGDKKLAEIDAARSGEKPPADGRRWFVNSQGQTMMVIQGPIEFLMGSPADEPGRETYEPLHLARIDRSFAVAAHEVTVDQVKRWNPAYGYASQYAHSAACPMNAVSWYEAAAYCNWLSEREGLEACYEPNSQGTFAAGMGPTADGLSRGGYRLPTEAEWELTCRAGAMTSRPYGASDALLGQYACYQANSAERLFEVGALKPNDLGLFDTLGNAVEWCENSITAKHTHLRLDLPGDDVADLSRLDNAVWRAQRGATFLGREPFVRSAYRHRFYPSERNFGLGFRVARTLPPIPLTPLPPSP